MDGRFKLILIGPQGVGKSSVADLVAHRCGLPLYELDVHCFEHYRTDERFAKAADELGDLPIPQALERIFSRIARDLGEDLLEYQEHLHLVAVKRALEEAEAPILDMGSGHCSYTIARNHDCLTRLLAPHPVLCLWPSRDLSRGAALLTQRNRRSLSANEAALRLHRGREIAKQVVYVDDRPIAEVADEAMARLDLGIVRRTHGP
jgi:hypothetical protein